MFCIGIRSPYTTLFNMLFYAIWLYICNVDGCIYVFQVVIIFILVQIREFILHNSTVENTFLCIFFSTFLLLLKFMSSVLHEQLEVRVSIFLLYRRQCYLYNKGTKRQENERDQLEPYRHTKYLHT